MNLGEACILLGAQGRVFAEIYKLYGFKDDRSLKDYLDFVIHEPVEWLKGFPSKWDTRASFGRPKTALIKLLKEESVYRALGPDYISHVHDIVWSTFKKHADSILAKRGAAPVTTAADQEEMEDLPPTPTIAAAAQKPMLQNTILAQLEASSVIEDAESVHSVRGPRRVRALAAAAGPAAAEVNWKAKYNELYNVVAQLVESQKESPLYGGFKALLAAHGTAV